MKIGDVVFQNYQGIMRFGIISKIRQKEGWSHAKVKWFNDEVYERAMSDLAELRSETYEDHALSEYRIDAIKVIDLERYCDTFTKIREYQQDMV